MWARIIIIQSGSFKIIWYPTYIASEIWNPAIAVQRSTYKQLQGRIFIKHKVSWQIYLQWSSLTIFNNSRFEFNSVIDIKYITGYQIVIYFSLKMATSLSLYRFDSMKLGIDNPYALSECK
jgi:hypothetical protein